MMTLREAQERLVRMIHAETDTAKKDTLRVELRAHELVEDGLGGRYVAYSPAFRTIHDAALLDAQARRDCGEITLGPLDVAHISTIINNRPQELSVDFALTLCNHISQK